MKRTALTLSLSIVTLLGAQAAAPFLDVYITKSGKKYHLRDCSTIKRSKDIYKISLSDAKREHTACKVCKPPTR